MKFAKDVAESTWFQNFIIGVIIYAGILVGMQTYKNIVANNEGILNILDSITLWIFVIEIVVKILLQKQVSDLSNNLLLINKKLEQKSKEK